MSDPAAPPTPLLEELGEYMASGVVIYVATANRALEPTSVVAMGAKAECERQVVTVYLPAASAEPSLANLRENPQLAVTLTRPSDHKSVQVKGRVIAVRESGATDRELQLVHRAALVEQFAGVGIPRARTRQLQWWPSVAVEIQVSDVFSQTPGPRAGERIAKL